MSNCRILVLAGDGIGPEVTAVALDVLERIAQTQRLALQFDRRLVGGAAYDACGEFITDETMDAARNADAILFGAEGGPKWDDIELSGTPEKRSGLTRLRRQLQLYANLRPIKPFSGLVNQSTVKPEVIANVDFVIVRELCGGIYFGQPRGIERGGDGELRGYETQIYTESEISRVARAAFRLARQRRSKLTSVEKSNVMESGFLWRRVVTQIGAAEFPDVALNHMLADNAAMQIIRDPRQFDVVVTDNLFGDILSDGAAMIVGSLGMLPSAALGEPDASGKRLGLYEPIHGSAPDIAGKNVANPIGAILSVGMLLTHSLMRPDLGAVVEKAVEATLALGIRTADIGGTSSTADVRDAVVRLL
jgi:3-isopropylmalate dehydrogenase